MPDLPQNRALSSLSMARGASPFTAVERCPLFVGLEHSDVVSVSMAMKARSFSPGEELCRAGEHGESLLLIVDGVARVLAPFASGAEVAPVAQQRRGDVVGAASLITGDPHPTTVVAGVPTEVLELPGPEFQSLLVRFPQIVVNFSRILSRRLSRSYAGVADERGRSEAVGLIFAESLGPAVRRVVEAAAAASPNPVASLDTRSGFHDAISQLDDLLEDHGTVVIAARAAGRSAPLLLDHVDRAVVLVEDEREAARLAEAVPLDRRRMDVVLVRDGSGPSVLPDGGRRLGNLPVTRVARRQSRDGPLEARDIAWLGRHLSRTKLGLALGAGGAKGYAHVGALAVLEEAGYTVDYVAGSSIGAIVGAYLALGMDSAAIDDTLRRIFSPETVADIFKLSLAGASTGLETMTRIFRETTGERSFEELALPLVVMTVDLTERAAAPLREGPLWEALIAATALAGMFPPYERDGHRLVDGLALVPVPTGSVYSEGADVVVSVNLMSRETLPSWPGQSAPPPAEPRKRGSRMLETILEVMDLSQLEDSISHAELADVVVNPRFGPASWRDFHLADLFLAAGREAAQARLPALEALATPQLAGTPT
jgi:NTE family protein